MILGVGTGRSGTLTLALLLDGCQGIRCVHEAEPLLPWITDRAAYKIRLHEMLDEPGRADVGFFYLPYLRAFLADVRGLKIIATRRDPEATANSFEAWMGPKRNHWLDHHGEGWEIDPVFDPAFPSYDIEDRHEAIVRYCREYDREVNRLRRDYPDQVLVVKTEDLGKVAVQRKIFDFAGIPLMDRCYATGAHFNRGPATRDEVLPFDLAELVDDEPTGKVTLYIGTYRKRRHIQECLRSVDAYMRGYDDLIFLDDSGDRLHTKWLAQYGSVVALPKVGHTVAMRALCAHAGGRELFWLEEDFELTAPVNIAEISEHLYHRPYLAQVALLRQALWNDEIKYGGVIEAQAANGYPVWWVNGLYEQTAWFTCNPGLWRGHVSALGWPNPQGEYTSEWVKSKQLRELLQTEKLPSDWIPPLKEKEPPRGYKFGYLPGVRCHHSGQREGHGY